MPDKDNTITLWRPERGVTCTAGLGDHADTVYSSKAACIAGMHANALTIMETKPGAFTRHLRPGHAGRYRPHDRRGKPQPPPNPTGPGGWRVEGRPVDPVVDVDAERVAITYTYEARFFWCWGERVTGMIEGVKVEAWKDHEDPDPAGWQPYVAAYSKDGKPTRSGNHLRPSSFEVTVGDPAAVAALLVQP